MNFTNKEIENYCIDISNNATAVLDQLEKYTKDNVSMSQMLTGKLETSFLQFLIKAIGAKSILEIGTYTGYATLAMAYALPENGMITTLDVDTEVVSIGQKFWKEAEQDHKITSYIGPALDKMKSFEHKFDIIFIDADKENYFHYFQRGLELLSEGGIIIVDNALWSGKVLDENDISPSTMAISKLNQYLKTNKEIHSTLIPVRDGILLIKP